MWMSDSERADVLESILRQNVIDCASEFKARRDERAYAILHNAQRWIETTADQYSPEVLRLTQLTVFEAHLRLRRQVE